jgi:hypothetical protein
MHLRSIEQPGSPSCTLPELLAVNLKRIHAYNAVNLKNGYPLLEMRTPREVPGDG